MGTFVFRWPHPDASDVHVTGTFDDWGKTAQLEKVGDIWEKEVELPSADDKILYKFVVDNEWVIDHTAPQEKDDHNNVNNVLYPDQINRKGTTEPPQVVTLSSAAPGSTTAELAAAVPLVSGETGKVDAPLPGTFPETPAIEPETVSVQPIPATSGIGNPIDIPAGESVPPAGDITANTIDSTVTTSKEDYEHAGESALPLAGAAAGAGVGAAAVASLSALEQKENLIPESSLPIGVQPSATADIGPTISSVGPTSTTAALAAGVPLEEKREVVVVDDSVPEAVKEAAASEETAKGKSAVEKEPLETVPPAPAPTSTAVDGTEDHTLANEPAVQLMNKHDAEAAEGAPVSESAPPVATEATEAPATTAPAPAAPLESKQTAEPATAGGPPPSATTTPTKKEESSPTSSPATSQTKEKKKKHRISSLFKKIFD